MSGRSFEEAIRRLEDVVRRLESGDLRLEEALELFAEGVELARYCHGMLDQAEQRLQVLSATEPRHGAAEGDEES